MDNTSSNWRTQIASFRFEACGCELFPLALSVNAAVAGDNLVSVTWNDSELDTVAEYLVRRSRTPGGPYQTIAVIPDSTPGIPNGPGYSYDDPTVSGGITYYYVVVASDGGACKSPTTDEEAVTATGACTLAPLFAGIESVSTPYFGVCTLDLFWSAASGECSSDLSYNIYRSTTQGFTPGPASLLASGIDNTTYSDVNNLVSDTPYYYVVRAVDDTNGVEEANDTEAAGYPQGQLSVGTWTDDAGDAGPATMILDAPWQIDPAEGNLGPKVYKTGTYPNSTCAALTTPSFLLGATSTLTFHAKYEIESSWDKGEVQISTDGGATWQRVPLDGGYPGTSTNASDSCGLPTGTYFTGTGLDWAMYTADLTAWSGQQMQLRFLLSTDSSQTRQGWWIDDLTITDVEVPGTCATGSSCEANPLVNVQPEGPSTICAYDSPLLTACTNGGTPPFEYQWYEDGEVIPGATGSSFLPADLGTHRYNVKVKAATCDDTVTDGLDTQITLVDTPYFDGLVSVADAQLASCAIDLSWNPGSTVCDGPLEYVVYRDTVPAVSATADKVVASGLTTPGWTDNGGLLESTPYYYLVRALDRSTGNFDANSVVGNAMPSGPGTGVYDLFFDDFEDPATFANWTVSTGPGAHTCGDWARSSSSSYRPSGGSGSYALSLSENCAPLLPLTSTILDSPVIDLGVSGLNSATLEFDMYYAFKDGGDTATVEVWDGAAWQVLWTDANADLNAHRTFDVTPYANAGFRVRFNYQGANSDKWFSVDNVRVVVDIYNACATSSGPAPAPDGAAGTAPLRADRATLAGDAIDVTWDVSSCVAADYNLIYGNLADLSGYAVSGSACGIGTSGAYAWSSVPAGDLFFLVVGTDGAGVESSWGHDGLATERNGMAPSFTCSTVTKDISSSCP
jgi:hypothetical protein